MSRYIVPNSRTRDGMLLTAHITDDVIDRLSKLQMVDGDVLIAAYPKTGITWLSELVWLVCNKGNIGKAKEVPLYARIPYMEFSPDGKNTGLDMLLAGSRPAIVKSHLPASTFMSEVIRGHVKVIIPIRNPKDTWVSLYHFYRMLVDLGNFPGSWDEFFMLCRDKNILYGDYFAWYSGWLSLVNRPNVLLVRYEDMVKNLPEELTRVASFLEKPLPASVSEDVLEYLSFTNMKENETTSMKELPSMRHDISPFYRKGVVGDWKNYFSEEQSELVDAKYKAELGHFGIYVD